MHIFGLPGELKENIQLILSHDRFVRLRKRWRRRRFGFAKMRHRFWTHYIKHDQFYITFFTKQFGYEFFMSRSSVWVTRRAKLPAQSTVPGKHVRLRRAPAVKVLCATLEEKGVEGWTVFKEEDMPGDVAAESELEKVQELCSELVVALLRTSRHVRNKWDKLFE